MAATVTVAGLLKPESPSWGVTRRRASNAPSPIIATRSSGYFSETNRATVPTRIASTMIASIVTAEDLPSRLYPFRYGDRTIPTWGWTRRRIPRAERLLVSGPPSLLNLPPYGTIDRILPVSPLTITTVSTSVARLRA